MRGSIFLGATALIGLVGAEALAPPEITAPPTPVVNKRADDVTAVTGCHQHGSDLYCIAGDDEYQIMTTATGTAYPAEFTGCHSHGSDMYCIGPDGEEVQAVNEADAGSTETDEHDHEGGSEEESSNQHCHFHAGVEHCVGGDSDESEDSGASCGTTERDYDVGLRVGLLFAILATSALGVFGPILLHRWMPAKLNIVFIVLKQFGTGIILSTAFIHLYTHASLMFANECIGELEYEGVTSAIVMAGILLSFVVEYVGHRVVRAKIKSEASLTPRERAESVLSSEVVDILVMEVGILFHSLLIGLTLVVAGDSFFITLFVVIVFHQMFEGIALGSRIATVGQSIVSHYSGHDGEGSEAPAVKNAQTTTGEAASTSSQDAAPMGLSMKRKLILASMFAFITPIGMAIGIGVLNQFNGNDKSTLIAIGTLDALSAGILVWVGLVEMWAGDWMTGSHGRPAELADADLLTVTLGGLGLVSGLVLMSVLGKWA